jgi:hypothetical protein
MHKSVMKCNETLDKWCKNKHGASKIIDTLETYQVGTRTKVDEWKALIGCLSWHRMLCRDDAHTMSIRMVWVKCTTSAECNLFE